MKKKRILILAILMLSLNFGFSQHFTPVWSGNPYQPMNIIVQNATIDGVALQSGDEVAVFDIGDGGSLICVGSFVLTGGTVIIVAGSDEPGGSIEGFTSGHDIVFKMWDNSKSQEITLNYPVFSNVFPFEIVYTSFGTASVTSLPGYSDVETTASTLSTCSGSVVVPITVEDVNLVTELVLALSYGTTNLTYTGYQNANSQLTSGTLSVTETGGDIDITWSSSTTADISSGTFIELLFTAPVLYSEATENILWDAANSYYINSYADSLETSFTNGIITIDPIPVAAGTITGTTSVCQGISAESYQVASITNASSYIWALDPSSAGTVSGTGASITIDYSSSFTGQVTLSVYGSNNCGDGTSSSATINVTGNSTSNAGQDGTSCGASPYSLSGTASNQQSVLWTTSGDGTFDNATILAASYTPSSSDISAGTVTLTLTAYAVSPCSSNATDEMTLTLLAPPVSNAGADASICEGSTSTLSGTASNQQSVLWSSSGDGTFNDATSLTAVYTPGSSDISSGSAVLTLTAYAVSPCTNSVSDNLTLTIQGAATANANSDASVCEGSTYTLSGSATNQSSVLWSTSGDGAFDAAASLTAIYTPSSNDISAGNVTLTLTASAVSPCSSNATDDMTLTIQGSPTANANSDANICEGSTYTLSGSASNQQSVLWSTSGNGTFNDATSFTATYTPGSSDISSGSAVLTLTANAVSPCSNAATDDVTITIQSLPTADAGPDDNICESDTYTLQGTALNEQSVLWTTSGDGTFDDPTSLTATYTPGSSDISSGSAVMTFTAYAGPCEASDSMTLSIQRSPIAEAGADDTICEDASFTLSGSALNEQSVLWTTSGDGAFDDATILTIRYTPGTTDIANGSVDLTLTAYAISPCASNDSDIMTLTIQSLATADAGANATICESSTYTLSGLASNQQSVLWSTTGDGTFDDATSLTAVYTPGSADVVSGSVTLTLTSYAISPCDSDDTDELVLSIQQLPVINAGVNDTIHEDSTFSTVAVASNYQSILWSSSGDGTFDNSTLLVANYAPGVSDIALGTAVLKLTANSITPCGGDVADSLTLFVQSTQEIDLVTGWNNMSFSKIPNNFNMISILQDLIDSNSLTKVISETGGFVQYIPGLGWLNTIGDMANTEGYYLKANESTQLAIIGLPVQLPFEIPLQTGWNIMGYPTNTPEDAQVVFQDLIDGGSFIKAIDEAGGFIQFIPGLGWLNTIGNLSAGEGYYIKVSSNDTLTLVGPTPAWQCGDTIVDPRDGQVYNTVSIGDQCWMAENLNVGTRIDGVDEQTDNLIIEKYCYDDDVANCDIYGGLYQWDEMMEYVANEGMQGICPEGWHGPTDNEWKTMEMELGMTQAQVDRKYWRGTDEGGKMKETDTTHWTSPNTGATNSSGFNALPGGILLNIGEFWSLGNSGYWWSSSETASVHALNRRLVNSSSAVERKETPKAGGFSIRCIKEVSTATIPDAPSSASLKRKHAGRDLCKKRNLVNNKTQT